jgi:hypothetical protein
MMLYDAGKILAGLAVFLVLVTAPMWWNLATGVDIQAPELELPQAQPGCVLPVGEMRASHMELLNDWRDLVVRDGERVMTTWDGRETRRSLTKTCLGCHTDKEKFCDRCHGYVGVAPYCWDCHLTPNGGAS